MQEGALLRPAAIISIECTWGSSFLLGGPVGSAFHLLRPWGRRWGWCAASRLGLWRAFWRLRLGLLVFLGLFLLGFVGLGWVSGNCFSTIGGGQIGSMGIPQLLPVSFNPF